MKTRQAQYTAKCGRWRAIHEGNAPNKLKAVLAFKKEGKRHSEKRGGVDGGGNLGAGGGHGEDADGFKTVPEMLKRSMSQVSFEGAALMARFAKTKDDRVDTTRRELLQRIDGRSADEILQESSKADFDLSEEFTLGFRWFAAG